MIRSLYSDRPRSLVFGLVVLATWGLFIGPATGQTSYTWANAANGTWQTSTAWSPNGTPGGADTATINPVGTYSVSMTGATTVGTVNINAAGATLDTSTQSFTVNTALNLLNGTLVTSGPTTAPAGTNWNTSSGTNWNWTGGTLAGGTYTNGGTLTMSVAAVAPNFSAALANTGTFVWNGAASIFTQNGSSLNNSGLFNIRADGTVVQNTFFTAPFTNTGTIRKSLGGGTSTIQANLTQTAAGTIEAQTGTLNFAGGGTVSGTVTASAGAVVNLGGLTLTGTLTGSGTGLVNLNNTTIGAAGATLNYAGSRLEWTNADVLGTGTLTIPVGATLNISQPGGKRLNTTLTNNGTVINTGAGVTQMNVGAQINNVGLFDVRYDTGGVFLPNGGGSLTNSGVMRKSVGAGTSALNVNFVNANGGTVSVQTGIMTIGSGGANPTSFTFNGASNLEITGGNTSNTQLNLPNAVVQGTGAVLTIKVMDDGTLIKTGSQVYNWTVITGAGTNLTSLGTSAFAVTGGNVSITGASVSFSGSNVVIQFTPVPEPTGVMLAVGAAAGAWTVRRRRVRS